MQPEVKVAGGVTPVPKEAHNHEAMPRIHLLTPCPSLPPPMRVLNVQTTLTIQDRSLAEALPRGLAPT